MKPKIVYVKKNVKPETRRTRSSRCAECVKNSNGFVFEIGAIRDQYLAEIEALRIKYNKKFDDTLKRYRNK